MRKTQTSYRASRRQTLRYLAATSAVAGAVSLGLPLAAIAQQQPGMPQPAETIEATLKRLFGDRPLKDAGARLKLDAPTIAENGAVVPIKIDADLPMTADNHVKHLYIIADKNRRPLNAKLTLTPQSGSASVATNIRLAATSDVRVVAEMSNGELFQTKREVKVTVGGCGG